MKTTNKLLRDRRGAVPVVVLWCILAIVLGSMAGITGYFLAQGAVAILAVIATLIILFFGILPILPSLVRRTRKAIAAMKYVSDEEKETRDDSASE